MANAAVQILQGFEDKAMPVDQAGDLMAWMGDLAGDSVENDTSLKDVSFTSTDCMLKLLWLIGSN